MESNVQKMREVCQKILDLLMLRGDGKEYCILTWDEFNESQKMLRRVLSVPPSNFDVGTVECGICHKIKPCTDLHHDWKKKGVEKWKKNRR